MCALKLKQHLDGARGSQPAVGRALCRSKREVPGGWCRSRKITDLATRSGGSPHQTTSVFRVKNEAESLSRRQRGKRGRFEKRENMKWSSQKGGSDQCGTPTWRGEL